MHFISPTLPNKPRRPTLHRSLSVLIICILSGTITAQENSQAQEQAATKLMAEGLQLMTEGSSASFAKAIEKFESARVLMHSLSNPLGEAALLSITGSAYFLLGQNQQAVEKYEQSLPLFHAAGDKRGEAAALLQTGQLLGTLGEMQKALDRLP